MNRFDGHEIKDWKPLIEHRCIVIDRDSFNDGYEVTVMEVSPAGRPKFRFPSGSESWENRDDILLIEDLGETVV